MFIQARKKGFDLSNSIPIIEILKKTYSMIFSSVVIGTMPAVYYFWKFSEKLDECVSIGSKNGWLNDEDYRMIEDEEYFLSKADLVKENQEILAKLTNDLFNKRK
jgi:hypothetical protein